ncbi:Uncharacterised protein [Aeromonas encheleia]|nr:Uncharacterised protein [Aeromonas encheleia]
MICHINQSNAPLLYVNRIHTLKRLKTSVRAPI